MSRVFRMNIYELAKKFSEYCHSILPVRNFRLIFVDSRRGRAHEPDIESSPRIWKIFSAWNAGNLQASRGHDNVRHLEFSAVRSYENRVAQ